MLIRGSSLKERWHYQCDGSVISVSTTPNCSLITAATVGRSVYLITSEGELVWKSGQQALDHECWSTAISSDGSIVAVGTANKNPADGSIYVFDARGELVFSQTVGAPVWSVSLSQDGSVLAASCWNGKAYKFTRVNSSYKPAGEYIGDTTSGLYGIRLNRDGSQAVLCAYDSALIVLNDKWKELGRTKSNSGFYNVALAEDAGLAVAGQRDGSLLLQKLTNLGNSQKIQIAGCARPICGVACSRRADLFVGGSFDGWVYLVNEQGLPLSRLETEGEVWSVACSDDAALICIGSGDHTVRFIENACSVAPIREVANLESTLAKNGSETETNLARLVRLYGQYGLFEYGYFRLRNNQETSSAPILYRKASIELLQNALRAAPDCYWAHYERGLIAQEQTRHQEAIHHFQQAARHPNFTSKAMTHCADSFGALKLPTATASCYRRAREQEIDGDAKRVLYNLSRSYEDTKQWHEAISHYQLLASWDADYRNTWERLEHLLSVHGATHPESTPRRADYTGITISLLGPDAPRDVDTNLISVLKARTAEVLIDPGERESVSQIIKKLRGNERFCRGITGVGLDYTQKLFLKYDYALPEDETKKFLETVNLLYLTGDSKPTSSLDIGSASGRYPTLMTWLGAKAQGIDIEKEAIKYAEEQKGVNEWPKYQVGDARRLPFKTPLFDLVTCMMGTVAHIPADDQQRVVTQIFDALLPGGCVAISTWDMECSHLAYLSIYNENQKDIIRKNSPSTEAMREMFKNAGFEDVQIRPFCMLPQIIVYDLGLQDLRSGDIQLAAQADLAVRSLYPNKHGEMFLAFARKPKLSKIGTI
jgi:SAM-dependent methyltransferase/tetratricopeptide (TPR) repeat protein